MILFYFVSNQWQISDFKILLPQLEIRFKKIIIISLRSLDYSGVNLKNVEIKNICLLDRKNIYLPLSIILFLLKIRQFRTINLSQIVMSDQPTRIYEVIFHLIYPGIQVDLPHTFFKGNNEKYQKIILNREKKIKFFILNVLVNFIRKVFFTRKVSFVKKLKVKIWEEDFLENENVVKIDNYHFSKFSTFGEFEQMNCRYLIFASSGAFRYSNSSQKNKMVFALCQMREFCNQHNLKLICVLKSGECFDYVREYTDVFIDIEIMDSSVFDVMHKYNCEFYSVACHSSLILELLIAKKKVLVYEGGFQATLDFTILHENRYVTNIEKPSLIANYLSFDLLTIFQREWIKSVIGNVGSDVSSLFIAIEKLRDQHT